MPDDLKDLLAQVKTLEARYAARTQANASEAHQDAMIRGYKIETLYRLWAELTPDEQMQFLTEVVTADQRCRLLRGLEDWSLETT